MLPRKRRMRRVRIREQTVTGSSLLITNIILELLLETVPLHGVTGSVEQISSAGFDSVPARRTTKTSANRKLKPGQVPSGR